MKSINVMMNKVKALSGKHRMIFIVGILLIMLCLTPESGYARCQLLAPVGTPENINGQLGTTEWSDAPMISSLANGCLSPFYDGSPTSPTTKPVEVRAKRDSNNLYLAFRVYDQTQNGPNNTQLPLGERLIIELSPTNLNGSNLGYGSSYKINIGHKWSQQTLDADKTFYQSTASLNCQSGFPVSGTVPSWEGLSWPQDLDVKLGVAGQSETSQSNYVIELKIPKSVIGISGAIPDDIAFAIVVVNDLGTDNNEAFASRFPSDLQIDTVSSPDGCLINPGDPTGNCNEWTQPIRWGLLSLKMSGDVYISRQPASWLSEDIDTRSCNNGYASGGQDQYNYYQDKPCRLKAAVTLRNTSASDEQRDVLVLAGMFGVGQSQWEKIEFKQRVKVPKSSPQGEGKADFLTTTIQPSTNLSSSDGGYLPPPNINDPGHPCVAVYVLPLADSPSFSKSRLSDSTTFTDADIQTMVTAYGIDEGKHSASQNTSRASQPVCPTSTCQTAAYGSSLFAELKKAKRALWEGVLRFCDMGLITSSYALNYSEKPGYFTGTIPNYFLEIYGRDNVMIRVRAFGYSAAAPPSGQYYRIVSEISGVIILVPVDKIRKDGLVPIGVSVGNPGTVRRTIFLKADTYTPPGFEEVHIAISTDPQTYEPGEIKILGGIVSRKGTINCCGKITPLACLMLIGGVFTLGFSMKRRDHYRGRGKG